ncbi:MAG: ribose 5-phosphate isomerase B [Rhodospirillaceae bacterium]|nr:ribose 5-phosphate isomerase B [Rhodospirillaceae bacterium]
MVVTAQVIGESDIVALACDHGGLALKAVLKATLEESGRSVLDLGTHDGSSVDYPVYAARMAEALSNGDAACGILICGTGIGISIAANRYPHIRAALVHDAFGARLCRQHNDANVLVFGGRTTGEEIAKDCLRLFLETPFEGGRHQRRVDMLASK